MIKIFSVWVLCIVCVACNSNRDTKKDADQINHAITSPLKDLNILREKIPAILLKASENPYALSEAENCDSVTAELQSLDKSLAPDIDQQPAKESDDNHIERGANALGDASIKALKRTTESLVPYRSWVRKLTGAEKTSQLVADAINAGNLRRAFLKGYRVHVCKEK
jgi:hypothetical protein